MVRRVKEFCYKYKDSIRLSTVILVFSNFIILPAGNGVPVVLGSLFPVVMDYFPNCAGNTVSLQRCCGSEYLWWSNILKPNSGLENAAALSLVSGRSFCLKPNIVTIMQYHN